MALGSHEGWKGGYGAADAAWDDSGSSSSSVNLSPRNVYSSSFGTRAINSSSLSCSKDHSSKGSSLPGASGIPSSRCPFLEIPPALVLEIFSHLDARELCMVSCVCTLFCRLSSDSHGWKDFYCERWGLPAPSSTGGAYLTRPGKEWRDLYMAREARSKAMMGRFRMDMLHGHTAAVRCVRLLPAANLVCTAGYDQTVRLWNLEEGLPISCSRPLGQTIRAIALDTSILAAAGTDAILRVWHAISDCPHLFDIAGVWNPLGGRGAETCLYGHTGPITCLGLGSGSLYSGSWDMSIKVWDRLTLKCTETLRHMDWVWALVQRGRRVLSTAGTAVYSWDIETGKQLRVRKEVHTGQAYAVEGNRSGHIVFTGGEDGAVSMFDDRISRRRGVFVETGEQNSGDLSGQREAIASWIPHSSAVYSLAFEDPWLVSASGDGSLAMMDVRQHVKRLAYFGRSSASAKRRPSHYVVSKEGDTAQRRLMGFNQSAYSVDVGADRVVSAGEEKIVRIWDFSHALEIERMVQASRSSQIDQRLRRKQAAQSLMQSKCKHSDFPGSSSKKGGIQKSETGTGSFRGKEKVNKEKEWLVLKKGAKAQVFKGSGADAGRTGAQ